MTRLERGIVLVGFMGAGKTTVARALAQRIQYPMMDLDEFIVVHEGRSIAEFIDQEGEAKFRLVESTALSALLQDRAPGVIALGGGTWTIEENRQTVAEAKWISVWLDAPFELCWSRIAASPDLRPLAPDETTARVLFDKRREVYRSADFAVPVGPNSTAADVVTSILDSIAGDPA